MTHSAPLRCAQGDKLVLPEFSCTEEAQRFGLFIDRDQYIFLVGARAGLQREYRLERAANPFRATQLAADLAHRIQLIDEALEMAPDIVLASLPLSTLNSQLSTSG